MGSWNKIGHLIKECKPCNYCADCTICVHVTKNCGTYWNDNHINPVQGATVSISLGGGGGLSNEDGGGGLTEGGGKSLQEGGDVSCVTDVSGACCLHLAGSDAAQSSYTVKVTHPGFADQTQTIGKCVAPTTSVSVLMISPIAIPVTLSATTCNFRANLWCATVTGPRGSDSWSNQERQGLVYVDPTVASTLTGSCPDPCILPKSTVIGPWIVPNIPCQWGWDFFLDIAPDCIACQCGGVESARTTMHATIAGQGVQLNSLVGSGNGNGCFAGCMTIPMYPTFKHESFYCGYSAPDIPLVPVDMPCLVMWSGTGITINAPMCRYGLPQNNPTKWYSFQIGEYDGINWYPNYCDYTVPGGLLTTKDGSVIRPFISFSGATTKSTLGFCGGMLWTGEINMPDGGGNPSPFDGPVTITD